MHTDDPTLTPWSRNAERGSYALLSGLMMASLVGFAAFSVDVSLITMSELQAQATADAASHAALMGYRINGNSIPQGNSSAAWIVSKNQVGLGTANLDSVEYGEWNYTNNTFNPNGGAGPVNATRAKVSRKASNGNAVKLLLAPILGVNEYDVDAQAVTAQQLRAMMLVMDMSCSMMTGNISDVNSPVNIGRVANIGFLNYMVANPQRGDLLGLSMFAEWANREPTATYPQGTRVSTQMPNRTTDRPWLPLNLIETQQTLIRQRINGICDTGVSGNCVAGAPHPRTSTIGSCTNPGPAMEQAVNELTDTAKVNNTYFKGMLFFSDGWPNCGNGAGGGTAASNHAWANDIYVWTILYANGGGDPAYMASLVRGAPTAFAQVTPTASQLPTMYAQVAKSMPTALVQ